MHPPSNTPLPNKPLYTIATLIYIILLHLPSHTTSVFYPQFDNLDTNSTLFSLSTCNISTAKPFLGSCWCTPLLDIRCSELHEIPSLASLHQNTTYGGLYLAHQKISTVTQGAFKGLKVQKIVLNSNNISDRMSSNAFSGLERVLRELYLGDCNLKTMPIHMLDGMKNLSRLHLWANRISFIPPGYFSGCIELRELILWGNRLSVIGDELFNGLWSLQKLDLDKNKITDIQKGAFRHLGRLEVIHLGENQIETIPPDIFMHLTNLKVLNLDGNRINIIYPKAFEILHNLISLSLNNNNLDMVPGEIFSHMKKLTAIFLQRNSLKSLWPNAFHKQKSLYLLNLSYNSIKGIPDGALRGNPHLKILYIDNNLLETVQMCVFSWKKSFPLRVISLLGNPLSCDCNLSWMAQLRKNTSVSIMGVCQRKKVLIEKWTDPVLGELDSNKLMYPITDLNLYRNCEPVLSKCG